MGYDDDDCSFLDRENCNIFMYVYLFIYINIFCNYHMMMMIAPFLEGAL